MSAPAISIPLAPTQVSLGGGIPAIGWPDDDGFLIVVALSQAGLFAMLVSISATDVAGPGAVFAAALNVAGLVAAVMTAKVP